MEQGDISDYVSEESYAGTAVAQEAPPPPVASWGQGDIADYLETPQIASGEEQGDIEQILSRLKRQRKVGAVEVIEREGGDWRTYVTGASDWRDLEHTLKIRRLLHEYDQAGGIADPGDERWLREALDYRSRERTVGGRTMEIIFGAIPFAEDIFLGGVVLKGGANLGGRLLAREAFEAGVKSAAEKRLIAEFLKGGMKTAAATVVAETGKEAAAAMGMDVASSTAARFQEELLAIQSAYGLDGNAASGFLTALLSDRPEVVAAAKRAGLTTLIEGASEGVGGSLAKIGPLKRVAAMQHWAMSRMLGKGVAMNEALEALARGVAYDGPFQEFLEERAGDAAKAAAGLIPWSEVWPELDQIAAEMLAFSAPALGGVAASRAQGGGGTEPAYLDRSSRLYQEAVAKLEGEAPTAMGAPGAQAAPGIQEKQDTPPGRTEGESSPAAVEDAPPAPPDLLDRLRRVPELADVSEAGTAQSEAEAALQAREAKAGRQVWFADLPASVEGYTTPEGEVILRRGSTAKSLERYAAHESIHSAALKKPAETRRALRVLQNFAPEEVAAARAEWEGRYREALGQEPPAELGREEAAALLAESLPTILPKLSENPEAVQELLKSRGLLQSILDALARVARRVGIKVDGPTIKRLREALGPDVPRGTQAEAVQRMADLATMLARIRKLGEGELRRAPDGEGGGRFVAPEDGRIEAGEAEYVAPPARGGPAPAGKAARRERKKGRRAEKRVGDRVRMPDGQMGTVLEVTGPAGEQRLRIRTDPDPRRGEADRGEVATVGFKDAELVERPGELGRVQTKRQELADEDARMRRSRFAVSPGFHTRWERTEPGERLLLPLPLEYGGDVPLTMEVHKTSEENLRWSAVDKNGNTVGYGEMGYAGPDSSLRVGYAHVDRAFRRSGIQTAVHERFLEMADIESDTERSVEATAFYENRGARYNPETGRYERKGRFAPRPRKLRPLEPTAFESVELPPISARSLDAARRKIQDFALPIQRWEEAIEKAGGWIERSVRDAIANMPGRLQGRHEEIQDARDEVFKIARRNDWWGMGKEDALAMLGDVLYAQEAIDRNRLLAEKGVQSGSGMTDQDAQDILDEHMVKPGVSDIAAIVHEVVMESTREQMADTGVISRKTLEHWRRTQPNYVPLRTAETDAEGPAFVGPRGRGFQVTGQVVRSMEGRRTRADNPLVFAFAQAQSMNLSAEKARVGKRLWEVLRHPDNVGLISYTEIAPPEDISEWDPKDAFGLWIDGERRIIKLSSEDVNRAMKGLGYAPVPWWLQLHARALRGMSRLITSWDPTFPLRNFPRDLGTAGVNIQADAQRAIRLRVLRSMPGAMRAIGAYEFKRKTADSDLGRYYVDVYRKEGGLIGWAKDVTYEQLHEDMLRELDRGMAGRSLAAIGNALASLNAIIEQGVRVAAAYELERGGLPREKAIRAARELTVDFNRRGESTAHLSAWKIFVNARIQGASQMLINMQREPKIAALGAGIAAFAFGQAIANFYAMGEDDDDENRYLKKPDWERDGYMLFPNPLSDDPGAMFKIPLAYGYNVFWVLGDRAAEVALRKTEYGEDVGANMGDATERVAEALWEGFSPISESSFAQMISPSGLVPLVQIAENEAWHGGPIFPDGNPFDPAPPPDSERAWPSVTPLAQDTARFINRIFGGNEFRAGSFLGMDMSVSPESIEHVFESYLGGVGKIFSNTASVVTNPWEETGWSKVPAIRSFYSETALWTDRGTFYENIEEVHRANREVEGMGQEAPERSRREARLYARAKQAAKDAKKLRDRHRAADTVEERSKLEEQMRELYLRFNKAFNETRR